MNNYFLCNVLEGVIFFNFNVPVRGNTGTRNFFHHVPDVNKVHINDLIFDLRTTADPLFFESFIKVLEVMDNVVSVSLYFDTVNRNVEVVF